VSRKPGTRWRDILEEALSLNLAHGMQTFWGNCVKETMAHRIETLRGIYSHVNLVQSKETFQGVFVMETWHTIQRRFRGNIVT